MLVVYAPVIIKSFELADLSLPGMGFNLFQIFFVICLLMYLVLLIVGLPIHWALGKFGIRKLWVYIALGALVPLPLVAGPVFYDAIYIKLVIIGTGATCASLFWLISVYLPKKQAS